MREANIVVHPTYVEAIEVQQVHSALSRHRVMNTWDHGRAQVRKSAVKSELTLFSRKAVDPCGMPGPVVCTFNHLCASKN
jgi:hypothetical protein